MKSGREVLKKVISDFVSVGFFLILSHAFVVLAWVEWLPSRTLLCEVNE